LQTPQRFECQLGGRNLIIETGKLAAQAGAAVTVTYGDTVVLVTGCIAGRAREGVDFLPLTVDYEERLYAAGKIPGGFIRREGRPSQEATLTMRLTDRPLRPLLPKEWRRDIQLIITVLSVDLANDPDTLALIGSSAALHMMEVPFAGPVGAVHIGCINDELTVNPTMTEMESSSLDLVVASTRDRIAMIEAGATEVSEEPLLRAIDMGHQANQALIDLQDRLREACGKPKADVPVSADAGPDAAAAIAPVISGRLESLLFEHDKLERDELISGLENELAETLGEGYAPRDIGTALDKAIKASIRSNILDRGRRTNGRGVTDVRPLHAEAGILPRTHGSGLFSRGYTQVLAITTLGSVKKEQMLDGLGIEESKRFMHHYNFPPFSVGETRRVGGPGRREIGHGALAERALVPVLPRDEDFPYTIRLVSEVLSSNGSTSMASVSASSLALMDAGVPISRAVAGIAMGLVTAEDGRFVVLTDLEGLEDFHGDMDFKVAGTSDGITAVQMDTKLHGLTPEMVRATLEQARDARFTVLDKMQATIAASRSDVSQYAPRMYKIHIDKEKIGTVIGPGGKMIRSIVEQTKTTVDIDDEGLVIIGSPDEAAARRAIEIIEGLTKEIEIGSIYTGKVTRLLSFGAFVEITPGKEGMVHISELANYRVPTIEDEVKVGDEITVKVIKNDEGKIGLSRKAVFENTPVPVGGARPPAPREGGFRRREPHSPRHPRPHDRGRPRR
jgi:polyribonucleotide nucleotidyltransferase